MHYLIQVNLYLVLFYGFYWFFLRKETFYGLNRAYLVGSAILSFGIPFWYSDYIQSFVFTQQMNGVIYSSINLETIQISSESKSDPLTIFDILKAIYFSCLVFFFLKLLFNFWELRKRLNVDNQQLKHQKAFSFFKFVFVDKDLQNRDTILAHEYVHIKQLHSFDVVLFELIGAICWFNPVVYNYKKAIKNIHEFIADEIASEHEASKADYAMLLFSQQFGLTLNPQQLTNQFFSKSTLKTRIEMLQKPRSKRTALLKYGLIVPLFMLMLVIASASIANSNTIDTVQDLIETGDLPLNENTQELNGVNEILGKIVDKNTGKSLSNIEVSLVKDKSRLAFMNTSENGKFNFEDADKANRLVLKTSNGYMVLSLENLKNTITKDFIEVNKINDRKLDLKIILDDQIKFPQTLNLNNLIGEDEDEIFMTAEEIPQFEGGINELMKFVGREIRYPAEARSKNITGKVFLRFVVEKNGTVSNPYVLRGVGGGCDEEAERVILTTSGKWRAGKMNGKLVRVYFTMPINFVLESKNKEVVGHQVNELVVAGLKKDENSLPMGTATKIEFLGNKDGISSKPLFVVDGVIVEKLEIKPEDISSVNVLKDKSATAIYGDKGKDGVILIVTKKNDDIYKTLKNTLDNPIYIVEDKEITKQLVDAINPNMISSVNVLKGDEATKMYGEKGKNGVVVIKLKK